MNEGKKENEEGQNKIFIDCKFLNLPYTAS